MELTGLSRIEASRVLQKLKDADYIKDHKESANFFVVPEDVIEKFKQTLPISPEDKSNFFKLILETQFKESILKVKAPQNLQEVSWFSLFYLSLGEEIEIRQSILFVLIYSLLTTPEERVTWLWQASISMLSTDAFAALDLTSRGLKIALEHNVDNEDSAYCELFHGILLNITTGNKSEEIPKHILNAFDSLKKNSDYPIQNFLLMGNVVLGRYYLLSPNLDYSKSIKYFKDALTITPKVDTYSHAEAEFGLAYALFNCDYSKARLALEYVNKAYGFFSISVSKTGTTSRYLSCIHLKIQIYLYLLEDNLEPLMLDDALNMCELEKSIFQNEGKVLESALTEFYSAKFHQAKKDVPLDTLIKIVERAGEVISNEGSKNSACTVLKYLLSLYNLCETTTYAKNFAVASNNLSHILTSLSTELEEAKFYAQESYEIYKRLNDVSGQINSLHQICRLEKINKKKDSSVLLNLFHELIELVEQIEPSERKVGIFHEYSMVLEEEIGLINNEVIEAELRANNILRMINENFDLAGSLTRLSMLYRNSVSPEWAKSMSSIEEAISIFGEERSLRELTIALHDQSIIYASMPNPNWQLALDKSKNAVEVLLSDKDAERFSNELAILFHEQAVFYRQSGIPQWSKLSFEVLQESANYAAKTNELEAALNIAVNFEVNIQLIDPSEYSFAVSCGESIYSLISSHQELSIKDIKGFLLSLAHVYENLSVPNYSRAKELLSELASKLILAEEDADLLFTVIATLTNLNYEFPDYPLIANHLQHLIDAEVKVLSNKNIEKLDDWHNILALFYKHNNEISMTTQSFWNLSMLWRQMGNEFKEKNALLRFATYQQDFLRIGLPSRELLLELIDYFNKNFGVEKLSMAYVVYARNLHQHDPINWSLASENYRKAIEIMIPSLKVSAVKEDGEPLWISVDRYVHCRIQEHRKLFNNEDKLIIYENCLPILNKYFGGSFSVVAFVYTLDFAGDSDLADKLLNLMSPNQLLPLDSIYLCLRKKQLGKIKQWIAGSFCNDERKNFLVALCEYICGNEFAAQTRMSKIVWTENYTTWAKFIALGQLQYSSQNHMIDFLKLIPTQTYVQKF